MSFFQTVILILYLFLVILTRFIAHFKVDLYLSLQQQWISFISPLIMIVAACLILFTIKVVHQEEESANMFPPGVADLTGSDPPVL